MNVELPRDAKGREIPLDAQELYACDGSVRRVVKWIFDMNKYVGWTAVVKANESEVNIRPEFLYLTKPDAWGKLLEDLVRGAARSDYATCGYFDTAVTGCSACPVGKSKNCVQALMRDIASRVRSLRGEDA